MYQNSHSGRTNDSSRRSDLRRSKSLTNLTVQENRASQLRKKLIPVLDEKYSGNSSSRLRYSRHSLPETSSTRKSSRNTSVTRSVNFVETNERSPRHTYTISPSRNRNSRDSRESRNLRGTRGSKGQNYKSPKRSSRSTSPNERNKSNRKTRSSSIASSMSNSTKSGRSGASSRQSDFSSSPLASTTEIFLRKIFKNGKWYEEREEVTYGMKSDGKVGKKTKLSQSLINSKYTPEVTETLSNVDPNYLDVDGGGQTAIYSRGIFQDDQDEFGKEILNKVNFYRMEHGARSVKLNRNLSVYAREWAKYLSLNGKIGFCHRHDIGEAVYVKMSPEPFTKIDADDIVERWYKEMETHDYDTQYNVLAPNFSQLIWKSTREIGVALERSLDGHVSYVVVFFHPKGNFPGDLRKQVYGLGGPQRMRRNEKGFAEPHFVERDESFVQAVLRACNFYRMTHNVVRLSLDKSLTEYAQEWAEQLALEDRLRPRPNNVYGENLYRSTFKINAELHGQEPVEFWYSTKKYHTFKDPADIRAAPFTQLIWSDSRDIGVGVAKSKTDRTYVVANFNPPGNLVGHFAEQVPPMKWQ